MESRKPFKILTIDGGGIKGLYSATILARLEEKSGNKCGDCFDMICGTSTGGLIALGLAAGKSAQELADFYSHNGKKIFPTYETPLIRWVHRNIIQFITQTFWGGKYTAQPLREVLEEIFGQTKLGELNNLVCIPSFNLVAGRTRVFKFPHKEGGFIMDREIKLVDAALATTAAPTYFPIHKFNDTIFVDGGLWANNPSLCGLLEALDYFVGPDREYTHVEVLSISSIVSANGWNSNAKVKRSFIGWRSKLLQTVMDGQAFFTHFFMEKAVDKIFPGSKYVRIKSPELSIQQMKAIDMDYANDGALETIRSLGNHHGFQNAGKSEISSFFKTKKTYNTK